MLLLLLVAIVAAAAFAECLDSTMLLRIIVLHFKWDLNE